MRILRGAVVVLAVVAAVLAEAGVAGAQGRCGGLLQPACPPPPPPPPPPELPAAATVTLTPASASRRIDSKRNVRLHGAVSGVPDPQGLFVELRQRVAAYGSRALVQPLVAQVKPDGTFEFELLPSVTVDVQAVLRAGERASGQSPVRRVLVRSIQHLSISSISATRGRFVLTSVGPSSVALATGKVAPRAGSARLGYLYLIAKGGRFALRIGHGRVRDGACATRCKRSAIGFFPITPAIVRERRNYLACARTSLFLGVQDAAVSPDCGKRRITLARPRAT